MKIVQIIMNIGAFIVSIAQIIDVRGIAADPLGAPGFLGSWGVVGCRDGSRYVEGDSKILIFQEP